MAGCRRCAGPSGCEERSGAAREVVSRALAWLYPTRRWGEPDDERRHGAGVCAHDGEALAAELAGALAASTWFVPGGEDEYCDYVYVQCVGREPNLIQIRTGAAPIPAELDGGPIDELYLRLCLSAMARLAVVQQVAVEGRWRDGELHVTERPRPGVYDPPLLPRLQRLVATLPAYDITHLDFGALSAPPAGFDPGDYAARYGGAPAAVNYLFYPQPSGTVVSCEVPAAVSR